MAIISKIERDSEHRRRYIVNLDFGVDEVEKLSLDESTIGHFFLRNGLEIDEFTLEEIRFYDGVSTSYREGLKFVNSKMRTAFETQTHLHEQGFSSSIIGEAIKKLKSYGAINDEEYAKAFVRTKKNVDRLGKIEIENQLKRKGMNPVNIEVAMIEYPLEEERAHGTFWVEKAIKKWSKLSTREREQRIIEAVGRKGFSKTLIKEILVESQADDSEELEALRTQGEKYLRKYSPLEDGKKRDLKIKQALYRKGFSLELIDQFLNENR